jgi:hypothetical protein
MFEDESEDVKGWAPVFTGLHRPKLIWPGIDRRLFLLAFVFGVAAALSVIGVRSLAEVGLFVTICFALAVLTIAVGLALGKIAPHLLDEIAVYLTIYFERLGFVASDDAGRNFAGVKKWKS